MSINANIIDKWNKYVLYSKRMEQIKEVNYLLTCLKCKYILLVWE
jgi:hypothetical protein